MGLGSSYLKTAATSCTGVAKSECRMNRCIKEMYSFFDGTDACEYIKQNTKP
jgi:hypothetical protein